MEDNPSRTRNQYLATIISTGVLFAGGMAIAWSSPVESQIVADENGMCSLDFCVSKSEFSLITASMVIGSVTLGFMAGPLMTIIGRKRTLLLYFVPLLIGWMFLTFASAVWMLYVGRALIGISTGGSAITVPIYLSEIAQTSIRGRLLSFFEGGFSCGLLTTYILGYFYEMFTQCLISTAIVVLFGVGLIFIPESPRYFVFKNDIQQAEFSLKWLRGSQYRPEKEIQEIVDFQKNQDSKGVTSLFTERINRRALLIVLGLITGFELSGLNACLFYTSNIFQAANIGINSDLAAIFVGACILLGVITSIFIVDKVGRKFLLLISYAALFVCFLVMGTYFQLQSINPELVNGYGFIPVVALCIYVFMNDLGATAMTFVIMGEVFAQNIKDTAVALSITFDFCFAIVISLVFPLLTKTIGFGAAFFVFCGFHVVAFFFVLFFVPETKGKSFGEIQKMLLYKRK